MIKDVIRYRSPEYWGVLCVDTWDHNGINDNFYHCAINELKNFNIKCVVNCTTDIKIDYNDPSIFNTFKHYQWEPKISAPNNNKQVMLNLLTASGKYESSRVLKEHLFSDHTIHLSDPETFVQHTNHFFPELHNWIVLGNTWHICLHYGPLGFDNLLKMPTEQFYIFPSWSVQTLNGAGPSIIDIEEDGFVWATVPNNGYQLVTKVDNKKWKKTEKI